MRQRLRAASSSGVSVSQLQRMDLAAHALAQRPVDQLVALQRPQAGELARSRRWPRNARCLRSGRCTSGAGQPGVDQFLDLFGIHVRPVCCGAAAGKARSLSYDPPRSAHEHARSSAELPALIAAGRRALEIEARAVAALQAPHRRDASRAPASCALRPRGRVVVSGLGKSGHIGSKIAATLASTGTPAFFLHAAEASHGDLGMVARGDVVLAISNSGETPELLALLPHLRRLDVAGHRDDRQRRLHAGARGARCTWMSASARKPAR